MSKAPKITVGYVHGPPIRLGSGQEIMTRAYEQRDYAGSVRMVLSQADNGSHYLIVWEPARGTDAGYLQRKLASRTEIGSAVQAWRRGYRTRPGTFNHEFLTDRP